VWFYAKFFLEISALVFASLLAAGALEKLGAFRRLASLAAPLASALGLPRGLVPLMALSLASPTAAYAILAKLGDARGVIAAFLLLSPLSFLYDALRLSIPIALSTLWQAAAPYIALTALRLLVFSALCYAAARPYLAHLGRLDAIMASAAGGETSWRGVVASTARLWLKISARLAAATAAVAALDAAGAIRLLGALFGASLSLGEAGTAVVAAAAANYISAMYVAGVFLARGELTVREALLALFAGQLVSAPLAHLRFYMPQRVGIFGARVAVRLTAYTLAFSEVSSAACLALVLASTDAIN
jgi:hypothetical protein